MGEDNKDIVQKANEVKQNIQTVNRAAQKASGGNYVGAAMELLKSDAFKKKLKKMLIMAIIKVVALLMVVVIVAGIIFAVVSAIKDVMVGFLEETSTSVTRFFQKIWNWLTGTEIYWTDLSKKYTYYIDEETR